MDDNENKKFADIFNNKGNNLSQEEMIEIKMTNRTKLFKPKSYANHKDDTENKVLSTRNKNREDLFAMRRDMTSKDKKQTNKSSIEGVIQIDKSVYQQCYNLDITNV